MKQPIVVLLLLGSFWVSAQAQNGSQASEIDPIDKLFGEGIFGTTWGSPLSEVRALHPEGSNEEFDHDMTMLIEGEEGSYVTNISGSNYHVRDDRAIFGLDRGLDDELIFTFYDGQLTHISIEFPDCPKLMSRLPRVIGPLDAVPADQTVNWRGEQVLLTVYARYNSPCSLVVMWCPVDGRPLMAPVASLLGLD